VDTHAGVHAFTAQLIDADSDCTRVIQDALADAGCLDIDVTDRSALVGQEVTPDLVILCVQRGDCAPVQRVTNLYDRVPVIAVCDEADIDGAFAAGATCCVTRPVRRRELAGRIREAIRRKRSASAQIEIRERKLSDTIAVLQREKQDLERLVCVDALTGIANRRHTLDLLAAEWKRCVREQRPLAIVMLDLDYFHAYNERYGHPGGDACLQRVADALVRSLRRPSDVLGRYGGEEFIAILPNTDSIGAKIVSERLRAAVEALAIAHDGSQCSPHVTITVGFAAIRVLSDDVMERLIAAADASLLEAKRSGRNRVGGYAPLTRPSRVSTQRWDRYAPAYVDPWFASRIPTFLEQVQQDVRSLMDSMHAGERRGGLALKRLDEQALKFGLPVISLLLRGVATAVQEGDQQLLRAAADELVQYVSHVQIVYRRTPDFVGERVAQTG
jgi:diguanylate cyclase (GGDEF)-like protein